MWCFLAHVILNTLPLLAECLDEQKRIGLSTVVKKMYSPRESTLYIDLEYSVSLDNPKLQAFVEGYLKDRVL